MGTYVYTVALDVGEESPPEKVFATMGAVADYYGVPVDDWGGDYGDHWWFNSGYSPYSVRRFRVMEGMEGGTTVGHNTIKVTRADLETVIKAEMIGIPPDRVEQAIRRVQARVRMGDARMYNSDLGVWIEVID